jgi:hypothetical protein
MGSDTSTTANVVLSVANSVTQTSVSSCEISCNQDQSDNTVIISPGSNVGNITFSQVCVIDDASCIINTNIQSEIENILQSTADQTAMATKAVFSATFTSTNCVSNMDQIINNQVQQLISNTCTIESNQTMNNNYVYVGSNSVVGDISFAQHSTLSNVECTMDNSSKAAAYNQETATVTQKATTVNMLFMLFMIFAIVAAMAFILVLVFLLTGGTKAITDAASGYAASSGGGGGSAAAASSSNAQLAQFAAENPQIAALFV